MSSDAEEKNAERELRERGSEEFMTVEVMRVRRGETLRKSGDADEQRCQ
jgi:hypothetical protein